MKHIFQFLYILACFVVVVSCGDSNKLYEEVMAIHDEVMPKMDDIMQLKQQLNARAEALKSDTAQNYSMELEKIEDLKTKLDSADKSMMVWMREFRKDYETIAKEELTDYLSKQKQRITQVGLFMNDAIAEAEEYLSE